MVNGKICNLTCLRHLSRLTAIANLKFIYKSPQPCLNRTFDIPFSFSLFYKCRFSHYCTSHTIVLILDYIRTRCARLKEKKSFRLVTALDLTRCMYVYLFIIHYKIIIMQLV